MGESLNGPLMVELEAVTAEDLTPETAPPIPESEPHAPTSVQLAAGAMAGQPNRLLRWALCVGRGGFYRGLGFLGIAFAAVFDFGHGRDRTIDRLVICRCGGRLGFV
jgi:hypothetical protein